MKIKVSKVTSYGESILLKTEQQAKGMDHFEGKEGEIWINYSPGHLEAYIGLGKSGDVTEDGLRKVASIIVKLMKDKTCSQAKLVIPELELSSLVAARAIAEGLVLSNYQFTKYKTKKDDDFKIKEVSLHVDRVKEEQLQKCITISEAVCYARDLVNESAHVMTPLKIAEEAVLLGKTPRCSCQVLDEKQLKKEGLGLLLAVGQASPYPPRLVLLTYKGDPKSKKFKAIVGKGITFDTGGLNLKPSGSMETMKQDMGGAAAVLGAFKAVSEAKMKVNLIAVVPTAYNAIGGDAYIPGDVYKSYLGKTVEIKNTDAEGRLILADALAYVNEKYQPECIVNLATLTGAIVVALGNEAAGIFSNQDQLVERLLKASEQTSERIWHMPIFKEHREAMKGDVADLNNLSSLGRGAASSSTAAAFLQEFVGDTPWAHLDIAGVAYNEKGSNGYVPKYGTGFGVRLLANWLDK